MNSLNILSARVIGRKAGPRSRSLSDGARQREDVPQPKRSASQHVISKATLDSGQIAEPAIKKEEDDEAEEDKDGALRILDEKSPLLSEPASTDDHASSPDGKPDGRTRSRLFVKRLIDAITESIRWVLRKIIAPGVYVITCFYNDDGTFSPLAPIRRARRRPATRTSSKSTAHALGLSGFSESSDSDVYSEKLFLEGSSSSKAATGTPATSDSELDSRRRVKSERREGAKSGSSGSSNKTGREPTRRSIRIKLSNDEGSRRKKQRKPARASADTGSRQDEASSTSPQDEAAAAELKSPMAPTASSSSLKLTKYPHAPTPPRPLIPRRQPSYSSGSSNARWNAQTQKTLVIDLDETLIHSLAKGGRLSTGHMVEVRLAQPVSYNGIALGPQHPILYYVHKRPHCDEFLRAVSRWYNLVVFTASVQEYADPVIDWLEQERKYFSARYYRQHCTFRNGAYIKDLSSVEPDLSKVMILDNSPLSYIFHEDNAIPIEGWINDPTDNDLLHIIPMLEALQYTTDVRAVLALRRGEGEAAQQQ